jgi:hypothetical protein
VADTPAEGSSYAQAKGAAGKKLWDWYFADHHALLKMPPIMLAAQH